MTKSISQKEHEDIVTQSTNHSSFSIRAFDVMYDHTFSKIGNHQSGIRPHIKVGWQPGDCIWSPQFSSGVCVGIYGITYSLYHPPPPKGESFKTVMEMFIRVWLGRVGFVLFIV